MFDMRISCIHDKKIIISSPISRPAVQTHVASGVYRRGDEAAVQKVHRVGLWTRSLLALRHQLHRDQRTQLCVGDHRLRE